MMMVERCAVRYLLRGRGSRSGDPLRISPPEPMITPLRSSRPTGRFRGLPTELHYMPAAVWPISSQTAARSQSDFMASWVTR